jgi:histidinol-phosphatase
MGPGYDDGRPAHGYGVGVAIPANLDPDLVLALAMADRADEITLAHAMRHDLRIETKPDMTPVTEVDQATERLLRDMIATERPDDAIVGEVYGGDAATGRRWILDPIDGTKNYVRRVPVWATLIALADDAAVQVGVVSAPALGRRWWAARGHGAWTTGPESPEPRRIQVSSVADLADASFSFSDPDDWDRRALDALMERTWRTRAYGDFWSHMLVAEGAVDIAAEVGLGLWDIAALIPVVEEAGGRFTSLDGSAPGSSTSLTTNSLLHDAVLSVMRD